MKITILGAGPGGFAMAADLIHSFPHFEVVVASYPEHSSNIQNLQGNPMHIRGILHFDYAPNVTCDVAKAISQADMIFVIVPAFGQKQYIEDLVKHGKNSQYVTFIPGYFASYYLQECIDKNKSKTKFYISELETLPFAAKFFQKHELTIKQKKKENKIAFFENYSNQIKRTFLDLFPTFNEESSVLKINLITPGPVVHVATTILNASRIEKMGSHEVSSYEITPSIAHVIEVIDSERKALSEYFNIEYSSIIEISNEMYPSVYDNIYDFIKNSKDYKRQISPATLQHRYITEEIPYHFVPIVHLAKKVHVPMPICESFIHLAGALNRTDYWKNGRNICKFFHLH